MSALKHFITPRTAMAIVVANMVGTGVFTSLGYQLVDIDAPSIIILLWVVGGITALCGALSYAELSARLPRSGGEYHFLREIYHPSLGFISGWVSVLVGFAAPTALAAMTFSAYLSAALELEFDRRFLAVVLVLLLTAFHCRSVSSSSGVQNIFTVLKIMLIGCFCFAIIMFEQNAAPPNFGLNSDDVSLVFGAGFAVSLIYVNYAFTGWNAVTYIAGELETPRKDVPRVLIVGTLVVMVLYVLLNTTFMIGAPLDELRGKIEVGVVAAEHTFGREGGIVMGIVLSLLLVSTVSAMILAGPRVIQVIGEDYTLFRFFSVRAKTGVPFRAILLQSGLTLLFVVTATFESVLVFSGFILGLNSLLAVVGVFVLRKKASMIETDAHSTDVSEYRIPLFPLPPLIFAGLMLWTLSFLAFNRPAEVGYAAALILVGGVVYWFVADKADSDRSNHIES